jgi:hypothetical protein
MRSCLLMRKTNETLLVQKQILFWAEMQWKTRDGEQ